MQKEQFKTSIGGQALLEGVMMKGPTKMVMSVRKPDGEIVSKEEAVEKAPWYRKVPFIRGTFNFIDSMKMGYTCMNWSADQLGLDEEEEELSPFEQKLMNLMGENFTKIIMGISMVLGVVIAVPLFTVMPTALVKWAGSKVNLGVWKAVLEGAVRIFLFLLYLWLISRMEEIHRVFQYHGAEHKSITCYEMGEELTPENAMKQTRLHPRCGTSFIFISLITSILVFSFVSWNTVWMRVLLKILLLPVVLGISYEIIRFAGMHDNVFTRIISWPGMQIQRLTTAEPDLDMLEVAITSLKGAMPETKGSDYL